MPLKDVFKQTRSSTWRNSEKHNGPDSRTKTQNIPLADSDQELNGVLVKKPEITSLVKTV